jgi:hypothetical protein
MTVELRLTRDLLERLHADLARPHPFASERVTFMSCRPAALRAGGIVLLGVDIHPVRDEDYERDDTVGAMLGSGAFRQILQFAYNNPASILHVHRHEHRGRPWFSDVDLQEAQKYIPDFWKVRSGYLHGILVLSHDSSAGLIWMPHASGQTRLSRINVAGTPVQEIYAHE